MQKISPDRIIAKNQPGGAAERNLAKISRADDAQTTDFLAKGCLEFGRPKSSEIGDINHNCEHKNENGMTRRRIARVEGEPQNRNRDADDDYVDDIGGQSNPETSVTRIGHGGSARRCDGCSRSARYGVFTPDLAPSRTDRLRFQGGVR